MPRGLSFIVCAALPLSGCSFFEALFTGLGEVAALPRFAYASTTFLENDPDNTFDDDVDTRVNVATLVTGDADDPSVPDKVFKIASHRPLPNVADVEIQKLAWEPSGDLLAVEVYEPIPGFEFDIWIGIFDRDLNEELFVSDDVIGGRVGNDCADISDLPSGVDEFLAIEIENLAVPVGTVASADWGNGQILSASFLGWLAPDRFLATLENDPPIVLTRPDGTETGPFGGPPEPWGELLNLGVIFEKQAGTWEVVACGLELPAVPNRPPASRVMGVASGLLTLDGSVVVAAAGGDTIPATRVDGPYP